MSSCWCESNRIVYNEIINSPELLSSNEGIFSISSAKLMEVNELTGEEADSLINKSVNDGIYTNIKCFIAKINYSLNEASKYIYNGNNFRLIFIGEENNKLKVLEVSEVPEYMLGQEYLNGVEQLYYSKGNYKFNLLSNSGYSKLVEENEDVQIALEIRNARKRGYVLDSNMEVTDYICNTCNTNIKEINYDMVTYDNISKVGFRPGYTYSTTYKNEKPINVKVYMTNAENYNYYKTRIASIEMQSYIMNVLPNEISLSNYGNEAIRACLVATKQYTVWNTIYYAKYPDLGYDLKDNTEDQAFSYNAYSSLAGTYKSIFVSALLDVYNYSMVTSKYKSLFESHYMDNYQTQVNLGYTEYGVLLQTEAKNLGINQGYSWRNILHHFYDNKLQEGLSASDVGVIYIRK